MVIPKFLDLTRLVRSSTLSLPILPMPYPTWRIFHGLFSRKICLKKMVYLYWNTGKRITLKIILTL